MEVITIGGVEYDSYASVQQADEYLAADFSATTWRDESDPDQKGRALISATRLLDRLQWVGSPTDEDQGHAWPRTGVSGYDDDEIPQVVVDACIVLANEILIGSTVTTSATTANNTKRLKAGSTEIEYFFPFTDGTRLPLAVSELLAGLLGSATRLPGAIAYDTDGCSVADDSFRLNQGI